MVDQVETVVLLHGLGRGPGSMEILGRAIAAAGYRVINGDYPSTKADVRQLAAAAVDEVLADPKTGPVVHFVTHSMGGILVRASEAAQSGGLTGRVVMLGPPNSGSELVDAMQDLPVFGWINGPAASELSTREGATVRNLGPAKFELGVIAGNVPLNPVYAALIEGPNDGKVSVASTRLDGMADHIVLPVSHTWMMMNPVVITQTLEFLRHGRFQPALRYGEAVQQLLRLQGS